MKHRSRYIHLLLKSGLAVTLFGVLLFMPIVIPAQPVPDITRTLIKKLFSFGASSKPRPTYFDPDSAIQEAGSNISVTVTVTAILPDRFFISQNYPNPFNSSTVIQYDLPTAAYVSIDIYNMLGQKVRTLVEREESAGSYTIAWDGTNASGRTVATGVYFYRFQAGGHVETKKMLLLK